MSPAASRAGAGRSGMNQEFWLDGFNLFHHWEATRGLLRPDSGLDIVCAIERSLRILGRQLSRGRKQTLVFLDGGLSRNETHIGVLRVRFAGPGQKADDRMLADLGNLGDLASRVIAVSNDRELKSGLMACGASCLGVGEYLGLLRGGDGRSGKDGRGGGARRGRIAGKGEPGEAEILRQKCRRLSEPEVDAWVDFFGGDAEA
ncbi:MAG: hypothetical protein LBU23_00735 [Planctomycetota bacterium]|nr:hypothetical protein [Planctomycetota bacterium]